MSGEIVVESVPAVFVSNTKEWFIPLMDWTGSGSYWAVGSPSETVLDAEAQIRNSSTPVYQGRIIRVLLPCKPIA
jgi:hypothetical protein